jgi:hypothetical protein
MPFTNNDIATSVIASLRAFTNWSSQGTNFGDPKRQGFGAIALHFRLRWTAANTFSAEWSVDGVSWLSIHSAISSTITPTHAGLALSVWTSPSGVAEVGGTFEYFRVYNS